MFQQVHEALAVAEARIQKDKEESELEKLTLRLKLTDYETKLELLKQRCIELERQARDMEKTWNSLEKGVKRMKTTIYSNINEIEAEQSILTHRSATSTSATTTTAMASPIVEDISDVESVVCLGQEIVEGE